MRKHCLALDLKDDDALIAKYEEYHNNVWPEVLESLSNSGINHMEIYRVGNRLFMIIEVADNAIDGPINAPLLQILLIFFNSYKQIYFSRFYFPIIIN